MGQRKSWEDCHFSEMVNHICHNMHVSSTVLSQFTTHFNDQNPETENGPRRSLLQCTFFLVFSILASVKHLLLSAFIVFVVYNY